MIINTDPFCIYLKDMILIYMLRNLLRNVFYQRNKFIHGEIVNVFVTVKTFVKSNLEKSIK